MDLNIAVGLYMGDYSVATFDTSRYFKWSAIIQIYSSENSEIGL